MDGRSKLIIASIIGVGSLTLIFSDNSSLRKSPSRSEEVSKGELFPETASSAPVKDDSASSPPVIEKDKSQDQPIQPTVDVQSLKCNTVSTLESSDGRSTKNHEFDLNVILINGKIANAVSDATSTSYLGGNFFLCAKSREIRNSLKNSAGFETLCSPPVVEPNGDFTTYRSYKDKEQTDIKVEFTLSGDLQRTSLLYAANNSADNSKSFTVIETGTCVLK